jgi:hypothetical protein
MDNGWPPLFIIIFLLMRRILPGPWPHAVLCGRHIEHSSKNYCTSITGDDSLTVRHGLACHDYSPEALSLVSVTACGTLSCSPERVTLSLPPPPHYCRTSCAVISSRISPMPRFNTNALRGKSLIM